MRRVAAFDDDDGGVREGDAPVVGRSYLEARFSICLGGFNAPAQESGAQAVRAEGQPHVRHVEAHVEERVPFRHGAFGNVRRVGNVRRARQVNSAGGVVDCNFKRILCYAIAAAVAAIDVAFKAGISSDSGVYLVMKLICLITDKQTWFGALCGAGWGLGDETGAM